MPLVINRIRGRYTDKDTNKQTDRHTHTHTHTHTHVYILHRQDLFLETGCTPACSWHTPDLKNTLSDFT